MLTVELMCLKLMHVIPDNLFKWIGGATSSVLGMVSGQAESSTAKPQRRQRRCWNDF
jgi:hypothetical protein